MIPKLMLKFIAPSARSITNTLNYKFSFFSNFGLKNQADWFMHYCNDRNYPVERHIVNTDDQYKLQVFRIQAKKNSQNKKNDKVVYLQHGLADSSDTWIINEEHLAPGFLLANQGYDVWIGNTRGNKYSSPELSLGKSNFWDFTFDQMAEHDLPAILKTIHEKTKKKIHYIGHSQGTLIMFIALSQGYSNVQDKIDSFCALGPVAYLNHQTSEIVKAASEMNLLAKPLLIEQLARIPLSLSPIVGEIAKMVPSIVNTLLNQISEMDNQQINNMGRRSTIFSRFPSGSSVKNFDHFNQYITNQGKFRKYDYRDKNKNLQKYKSHQPPTYNLSNIKFPVNLFVGQYDRLANVKDCERLFAQLTNSPNKKWNLVQKYGHSTFIWGNNVRYLDSVVDVIENRIKPSPK